MGRKGITLLAAASAFLALACNETKTPTEPYFTVDKPTSPSEASLSGIVTDQNGIPQPGLVVTCQGKTVTTTAGGPAGFYGLTGLKPGGTTVGVYQKGQKDPSSFGVELAAGLVNTKDFAVVLFHGSPASLAGKVVPTGTRPIADGTVWCQGRSANVAADGSYVLTGLESGYWELYIEWSVGGLDLNVTLGPGANTQDFTIPY